MKKISLTSVGAGILGAVTAAGIALAADQTILGNVFTLQNPGAVAKRRFVGTANEKASPNTIVGDPTVQGATLEVTVLDEVEEPTIQTFDLPASGWSARRRAFTYKDAKGVNGPVKTVSIKIKKGRFLINVLAVGKNGLISLLPPDPGTGGCFALRIKGGDRYSVEFGETSELKNRSKLFQAKKPGAEGVCPSGVIDPGSASPSFVFIDDSGLF